MRTQLLSWLLLILLCSIIFGISTVVVRGQCLEDQRLLLLQMKNSLVINPTSIRLSKGLVLTTGSTKLITWDQRVDCCLWSGVTCDNTGRVIGLDLSIESISDGIDSSTLFDLQYLQSLNLANNRFNDTEISPRFGNLTNLIYLNLSNAGFSGQIPIQISFLTRLVTLDISSFYYLFGNFPLTLENPNLRTLVRNLSSIEELYLDGVNISAKGYEWCQALSSSLPNLRVLSLSGCVLSGPIDSSLAMLQYLSVIRLDYNDLSTPVPEFFANFRNLTILDLSSSSLNGKFPEKIFQLPKLQSIDLADNELLEGYLPAFLPENGSLQTLVLSFTKFSGNLPDSIGNLKRLSYIELANCNFNGPIPNSMGNLDQLVYLDFSVNGLNGSIPSFHLSKNLTQIVFSHNRLMGQIPSNQWEGLANLVNIDLSFNSLNGCVPLSLFSLLLLQEIQLSNNQFSGSLNGLANVSSYRLNWLDLSNNKLEGPIPTSLFELQGLNFLSLSYNNFNGTIDRSLLQNLKNLFSLELSFNNLSINMSGNSSFLSALPQLTTLKLASCKLGMFPNLKNPFLLSTLDLSHNQIRGKIPNWLWSNGHLNQLNLSHNMLEDFEKPLPNRTLDLSTLDLHSNLLQGQIPILTSSATFLDYSNNNFSSPIPANIGNYIQLAIFFSLSNNSITGRIPKSICNASWLLVLDLSDNSLNGTTPPCLLRMGENLGVLNLRSNQLSGHIPDEIPTACNLKTLDFNGNQIDGSMPRSLGHCTTLEVLDLGNNRIIDGFPCWLENSSTLQVLVLRSNRFYGSIQCPGSDRNLPMLQIFDLASNNFNGSLTQRYFFTWKAMISDVDDLLSGPDHLRFEYLELSHLYYQDTVTLTVKGLELKLEKILTVYTSIDLSNNRFEGNISEEVGKLNSLYVLNLSHNAFTGRIPDSLGNLSQLESLDLSYNELTGSIPTNLTSLYFLSFLNLSFNQLVGEIPRSSQLDTFENTSYLGNRGLCGFPLREKCSNGGGASPKVSPAHPNSGTSVHWKYISVELGFTFGLGIVIGPLVFCNRWRNWYYYNIDRVLSRILRRQAHRSKGDYRRRRGQRNNRRRL